MNEFKKKTEFFDEDHDKAYKENHGSFEANKEADSGSAEKGENLRKMYRDRDYGKSGKFEKGLFFVDDTGHKEAQGKDSFYNDEKKIVANANKDLFKNVKYSDSE